MSTWRLTHVNRHLLTVNLGIRGGMPSFESASQPMVITIFVLTIIMNPLAVLTYWTHNKTSHAIQALVNTVQVLVNNQVWCIIS